MFPGAGLDDDWHDADAVVLAPRHEPRQFFGVDEVGGDEGRADEEQRQVAGIDCFRDAAAPVVATIDAAVLPGCDQALALKAFELLGQLFLEGFVLMRIADEDRVGRHGLLSSLNRCAWLVVPSLDHNRVLPRRSSEVK